MIAILNKEIKPQLYALGKVDHLKTSLLDLAAHAVHEFYASKPIDKTSDKTKKPFNKNDIPTLEVIFANELKKNTSLTSENALNALRDFSDLARVVIDLPEGVVVRQLYLAYACISAISKRLELDKKGIKPQIDPNSSEIVAKLQGSDTEEELAELFAVILRRTKTVLGFNVKYGSIKDLTNSLKELREARI